LRDNGVAPGAIVGIMSDRSPEIIIGVLGILKAGAAYLPIDPDYPGERIDFMLRDSAAKVMVADDLTVKRLNGSTQPNDKPANRRTRQSTNLAYVLYTSGSTGIPKGVMVEHRNVVRLVKNTNYIRFETHDRILQTGPLTFDASTFEVWGALLNGLTLCLTPKEDILVADTLKRVVRDYDIGTMWLTAPLFNQLVRVDTGIFNGLRHLLVGGDVLSPSHIKRVTERFPRLKLINGYGPTENTTFSTTYHITGGFSETIPIGKPIANSVVYILDKYGRTQPVNVTGELCVGGDGVSRGYLNNPELTSERFIRPNVSSIGNNMSSPGNEIYKTGDLARWMPDGNIEFLGRIDHQVKIRGFRIEPGEIENQLLLSPYVKEVVVTATPDSMGDKLLIAYIVPDSKTAVINKPVDEQLSGVSEANDRTGTREFSDAIQAHIKETVPEYMVPSHFIFLDQIPLNPNGKVDRKSLPEPGTESVESRAGYVAPVDETEITMVDTWSEVLGIDRSVISTTGNFFELGGHSLKATILISKIHKALDIKLPLAEVFRTPTIRELAQYIRAAARDSYAAIEPVDKQEYYPLSSAQKRLYILYQMDAESTAYNIPQFIPLLQTSSVEKLEGAFTKLIQRHESLRTSFHMIDNQPVQRIHGEAIFKMEDRGESDVHSRPGFTMKSFVRPFDLSRAPLLRVGLAKKDTGPHILMVDMHHIISDGVSMVVLERDFMALYKDQTLPPLRIQYKDFAQWQNSRSQQENIADQTAYWLKEFEGEIPVLQLPTDYPRPVVQGFGGSKFGFRLSAGETGSLRDVAMETGSTLFMVLLSLTAILLSKLSGQEDIVIGTPIAGRRHADLEKIIGMFVNTLAMRNYPAGGKTVKAFLQEVKERTLTTFDNQEYQFEDLVERAAVRRDAGRNPLFDVMLSMQNMEAVPGQTGGSEASSGDVTPPETQAHGFENVVSKFDMTLTAVEGAVLSFQFTYNTALFKRETIQRFTGYFKNIVSAVTTGEDIPLYRIEVMSDEEKHYILYDLNDTETACPTDQTIHRLFETQAEKQPDHIALMTGSRGTKSFTALTYRELNRRSHCLASLLKTKGAGPHSIAAIMSEPTPEMIVAILAVLKTGACYLPIEPSNPVGRVSYMLSDSQSKVLIGTGAFKGEVEKLRGLEVQREITTILMDSIDFSSSGETRRPGDESPAHDASQPSDPAYVIYTSGTTGQPKGVMVNHGNLVNYVNWFSTRVGLTARDRSPLTSSFGFDLGYTSLFPSLLKGGQLHILSKETYMLAGSLLDYIARHRISYLKMTPSLFSTIVDDTGFSQTNCRSLRLVVLGGEAIDAEAVDKAYRACRHLSIMNHYGPTEATIGCIAQFIDADGMERYKMRPTIGRPIFNTRVFILDKYLQLTPPGISGELCLSGAGVSTGYFKQDELTAEKFIANTFTGDEGGAAPYDRIYRTGDLARWLPDDSRVIEFLGRIDQQVKVRGYRIELGEIQGRLQTHERVKESVVMARDDGKGNKYLCAYVVPVTGDAVAEGESIDPVADELKTYLSVSLPDYMIPSHFTFLEALPLTPNGKTDFKALPAPTLESKREYQPPRNRMEERLTAIWWDVLDRGRGDIVPSPAPIGIDDNFFEVGGQSLKATVMISKIHRELNVRVPLAQVFKAPTIKGLSDYIKESVREEYTPMEAVEKREYYPLSSAQRRLYILQQMDLDSSFYNMPRMIPLGGVPDMERLEETFVRLIHRHESLRTSFHIIEEEPVQRVHDHVEFKIKYYETDSDNEQTAASIIDRFVRPFDLSHAPLLRAGVIKSSSIPSAGSSAGSVNYHMLMVDMHHTISDGISRMVLTEDFRAMYSGDVLEPLKLQYKDFSQWQNSVIETENIKRQETYWLKEFEGEVPVPDMPLDYPRPAVQSFEGNRLGSEITAEHTRLLRTMALENGVTLYMVLTAVCNVLLSKLGNTEDVVLGSVIAGRRYVDLEKVIGMFVNTLALRNRPRGGKAFGEFLQDVKERSLAAFENQEYQFEDLVEKVSVKRDTGRNPLFDVMFILNDINTDNTGSAAGNRTKSDPGQNLPEESPVDHYEDRVAKFDLTIAAVESGQILSLGFQYCTKLFKKETVQRFIGYFERIVSCIVAEPRVKLSRIEIISPREKQRLLFDFNDTGREFPGDKTIHEQFENQVEQTPDRIAVIGTTLENAVHLLDGTRFAVSYGELNEKSNRLARLLRSKGVRPDTIVGIMVPRSIELIIGIFGILKAGGAYLPIDYQYPGERIDYMLADSSANLLLSHRSLTGKTAFEKDILYLENDKHFKSRAGKPVPGNRTPATLNRQPANSLAYVIYTSGSTGRPKGVLVEHKSLVNYVRWGMKQYIHGRSPVFPLYTSISFDLTVTSIFLPFICGGRVIIYPGDENQLAVFRVMEEGAVDIAKLTPSHLSILAAEMETTNQRIHALIVGGEKLEGALAFDIHNKFSQKPVIYNEYGPTEATVGCMIHEFKSDSDGDGAVPIGVPISNAKIYLLDNYLNPV
ncbi:MAG: amino acid adenylation domain-containing protein, partial [bacterium]|nr:amino acid adenylation domain-containing protein [bacterium]